jgi:hypothetical protein
MAENDLPLEHVIRSLPPWRRCPDMTECGKPAAGRPVITRDQFLAKVRAQGKQRSSLTTCMTCWNAAARHPSWDENPVDSLLRESAQFRWSRYGAPGAKEVSFRDELIALAALVEAHRDEFDELLTGLGDTVRLDEARQNRRRRRLPPTEIHNA